MANQRGHSGISDRFYFLGLQYHCSDWSQEIKRPFLLGRKTMTILNSMLKSRDITLPTKVCLLKPMFFPVVMCRCEIWSIKKAKFWRIDAFKLWCWRRLFRVPWTAGWSNQLILKEINHQYSLEELILKLKLQYFCHLMQRADSLAKIWFLGKDPDAGNTEGKGEGRSKEWSC